MVLQQAYTFEYSVLQGLANGAANGLLANGTAHEITTAPSASSAAAGSAPEDLAQQAEPTTPLSDPLSEAEELRQRRLRHFGS
jgi:hypothetical protein